MFIGGKTDIDVFHKNPSVSTPLFLVSFLIAGGFDGHAIYDRLKIISVNVGRYNTCFKMSLQHLYFNLDSRCERLN